MNNTEMLAQAFGKPVGKQIKKPTMQKIDPQVLLNYMPVGGTAKRIYYHNPQEIQQGVDAFRGMMAERRGNMIADAQRMANQAQQAINSQVIASRKKIEWMKSLPETRTLARIQKFMNDKGKSMGNSFHF